MGDVYINPKCWNKESKEKNGNSALLLILFPPLNSPCLSPRFSYPRRSSPHCNSTLPIFTIAMENLPEALISEIIKRLTKSSDRNSLSLVSKELYKIEANQRRSIWVKCGLIPVTEALTSLCTRFPNLAKIEICNDYDRDSYLVKQLNDQGLFILSTNCPSLTNLTLKFCSCITDSGLSHLASCKKLVDLSILECRGINETSLVKLGNCLRRLKRLEFKTHLLGSQTIIHDPLVAESWFRDQICCERLEEVNLCCCALGPESGLSLILGSCSSLEKVRFYTCTGLDDSDIISLSKKSRGLKSISLMMSSPLTDVSLKALGSNCPSLENVELAFWYPESSITIEGILALVNGCSIRVLVLRHARFLNDSAMQALSLASPCLETLEIEKARQITNLGFLINFPRLVNLKINGCHRITDDELEPLIKTKKLHHLMIKNCPRISHKLRKRLL
ncbi:hypothetical protein LUZ60_000878 [Juncus effusus]|nr:hypothetical protein LUZ60_000878 [Juncus effusus]